MKRIQNISLSLTSLLSECGGHQGTPRTLLLALLLFLALISCQKRPQPTTPDDQKTLIGFSAVSQSAAVKSTTSLSTIHDDFGVWGIARQEGNNTPYVLWESDAMCQVVKSDDNSYVPVTAAYWLSGYTYNFMAVAPYEAVSQSVTINQNAKTLSFTYDMGAKYTASEPDYDFDLMGAVAQTVVGTTKPTSQDLTFWHLFSQICINVIFEEADKTPITGTVDAIRLSNVVTKAGYEISFDDDKNLDVLCVPSTSSSDKITSSAPLVFNQSNKDQGTGSKWTIHILPQDITGFELYLDFTLGGVAFNDFKVNLNTGGNKAEYAYNERYNWNITIGPKATVSFSFKVQPWGEEPVGEEIPII